ncbi:uncharacterized protein LODBEIA_P12710 [Lodderomyces beijingensis]|uniref:Ubiquitin carboxyl-terminal hydrolase n=1 Tax=Lodderomyces beijingensis TaxID=1775926 RepID=A0ABP0ZFV4_9ASCO
MSNSAQSSLNEEAAKILERLIALTAKASAIVGNLIKLLELFNRQYKLRERVGYCDYEIAYVSYVVMKTYLDHSKAKILAKSKDLYTDLFKSIEARETEFNIVANNIKGKEDTDPLKARLNALKGVEPTRSSSTYKSSISPSELERLITKGEEKCLLIDYRLKKDYLNNHIKYAHLVNIDPSIVHSLPEDANDADLESALRYKISYRQLQIFQERHKYEYVVMYNYKYGAAGNDRFANILFDLESNQEYPFTRLVDLLMFRNKYLSSRLKVMPSFLSGGVYNWYTAFGEESLEKSDEKSNSSFSNGATYSTSFVDYLAKSKDNSTSTEVLGIPLVHDEAPANVVSVPKRSKPSTSIGMQPYIPAPAPAPEYKKSNTNTNITTTTKTSSASSSEPSEVKTPKSNILQEFTTGLVNLGNSCYMNCMLQCLVAAPELSSFFFPSITFKDSYKQHINVNNKLGTQGRLTSGFVELMLNMLKNNGKVFSPSKFKAIVGSISPGKQFATCDQQDCVEFLEYLLDGLHEDLNQMAVLDSKEKQKITELTPEQEQSREILPIRLASTIEWERYLKLNFSIIVDKLQGQYLSRLKCLECGFTSTSYNAFSILNLPIPKRLDGAQKKVTLQDCLDGFITTELLDDNNKWYCPKCKRFTKSTKTIAITRLPQILIINFKRFKLNEYDNSFKKLETFVAYPVTDVLDLTKYWSGVGSTLAETLPEHRMTPEQEQERLNNLPKRNQEPPFKYKLFGVANHFGNLTTGHYTAYVYKNDTKQAKKWCYFDDSKVTFNVSPSQVMNKNAYCLFFHRV